MRYDAFICYRRNNGSELASYFQAELKLKGISTFLDVEERKVGDFRKHIEGVIENCSSMIILLTEGSIERFLNPDDISRNEVEYALSRGIPLIPVNIVGEELYTWFNENPNVPECLTTLRYTNCVTYKHELKSAVVEEVYDMVKKIKRDKFEVLTKIDKDVYNILNNINEQVKDFRMVKEDGVSPLLYTGNLKEGIPWGKGLLHDINAGLLYDMEWRGLGKGEGKVIDKESTDLIYEGTIDKFLFEGKGTYTKDFETLQGFFQDGEIVQGKKICVDYTYEGEFKSGVPHGYGNMSYSNGSEYAGMFYNGKRQGLGTLVQGDTVWDGSWIDDEFREGMFKTETVTYKGGFKNGNQEGSGILQVNKYQLNNYLGVRTKLEDIFGIDFLGEHETVFLKTFFLNGNLTPGSLDILDAKGKIILSCSLRESRQQGNFVAVPRQPLTNSKGTFEVEYYDKDTDVIVVNYKFRDKTQYRGEISNDKVSVHGEYKEGHTRKQGNIFISQESVAKDKAYINSNGRWKEVSLIKITPNDKYNALLPHSSVFHSITKETK